MELIHRRLRHVDVLEIYGRIGSQEAAHLKERIDQCFKAGRYHLVLDLSHLESISSAGLRVLLDARKRARGAHLVFDGPGDVRLVNLPPRIKDVFDLTGLTDLFQRYDELVEAVASY